MWDKIPEYKKTIRKGLEVRRYKTYGEGVLLVMLVISVLVMGYSEALLMVFIAPSFFLFVGHLLILRFMGYFEACHFFGISGHAPDHIIERRLLDQPIPEIAKFFWIIEDR